MPVYHLIFRAYGSWLPDHRDGYYSRAQHTHLPPNAGLGAYCRELQTHAYQPFTQNQQLLLLKESKSIAERLSLGLHAIAVVPDHMHLVVSWNSNESVSQIKARLKQHLTFSLNSTAGGNCGRWFSRGAGAAKIRDWDHLVELMRRYIPEHAPNLWIEERIQLKL